MDNVVKQLDQHWDGNVHMNEMFTRILHHNYHQIFLSSHNLDPAHEDNFSTYINVMLRSAYNLYQGI